MKKLYNKLKLIEKLQPACNIFLSYINKSQLQYYIQNYNNKKYYGLVSNIKSNMFGSHNYLNSESKDYSSASSEMLHNFISPYVSTVFKRMYNHGVLILGKTNSDEFCSGCWGDTSYYKPSYTLEKELPGGSSSGAILTTLYDLSDVSLGTDTGGSSRFPAIVCKNNIIGFKPTLGAIPMDGMIQYGDSLDTVGLMGKNIDHIISMFNILKGKNNLDNRSIDINEYQENNKPIKICVLYSQFFNEKTLQYIKSNFQNYVIEFISYCDDEDEFLNDVSILYETISSIEIFSNLQRYESFKYYKKQVSSYNNVYEEYYNKWNFYGDHIRKKLFQGAYTLSSDRESYYSAIEFRSKIFNKFNELYQKYDYIITPSCIINKDKPYLLDACLMIANLIQCPSAVFHIGDNDDDISYSINIMSARKQDLYLLHFIKKIFIK
ncbi:Glutamyl-tRNA(Gln) amidotransferase subunit A [bacterium AB1]|nr:Glutamyl-tRNA(Gln) amidotransferase subunit A [bacterium AB1]